MHNSYDKMGYKHFDHNLGVSRIIKCITTVVLKEYLVFRAKDTFPEMNKKYQTVRRQSY